MSVYVGNKHKKLQYNIHSSILMAHHMFIYSFHRSTFQLNNNKSWPWFDLGKQYGVHWQQTSTYHTLQSRSSNTPWCPAWPPKSIGWSNIIPSDVFAVLSCNNVKPKPYSSVGANHNKRSTGMSTHWNPSITHNRWPNTHKWGSLCMPLRMGWVN